MSLSQCISFNVSLSMYLFQCISFNVSFLMCLFQCIFYCISFNASLSISFLTLLPGRMHRPRGADLVESERRGQHGAAAGVVGRRQARHADGGALRHYTSFLPDSRLPTPDSRFPPAALSMPEKKHLCIQAAGVELSQSTLRYDEELRRYASERVTLAAGGRGQEVRRGENLAAPHCPLRARVLQTLNPKP